MNGRTSLFVGAVALAIVVTMAPAADARGVGAGLGHSYPAGDSSCFSTEFGYVDNNFSCSGSRNWEVALPVDSSGSYNPTIWFAQSPLFSTTVSCDTFAISADGQTVASTGYVSAGSGTSGSFQPGSETVPTNGYLFVGCNLTSGSSGTHAYIYSIVW